MRILFSVFLLKHRPHWTSGVATHWLLWL